MGCGSVVVRPIEWQAANGATEIAETIARRTRCIQTATLLVEELPCIGPVEATDTH